MRNKKVSIRGGLMRDMIHDIMETSLGKPIQTGEFRKNPVEPAWVCPSGYEYEIIENGPFKMEFLKPEGVVTGRAVLQLHGGGYIGPMKNIYRKFAVRYSRLSFGGDVLTADYRVAPEYPYPAALEDALHAYQWLVKEKRYRPDCDCRGFGRRRTCPCPVSLPQGPRAAAARRAGAHVALGGRYMQR